MVLLVESSVMVDIIIIGFLVVLLSMFVYTTISTALRDNALIYAFKVKRSDLTTKIPLY